MIQEILSTALGVLIGGCALLLVVWAWNALSYRRELNRHDY